MLKRGNFTEIYIDFTLIFSCKINAMQCNAAEMWLNTMCVNALIFSQIDLKIKKKSMH